MIRGDRAAQLRQTQRFGVSEHLVTERLPHRVQDHRGRTRRRLPGCQGDHVAVRALTRGRRRQHVHDVERRNVRAPREVYHGCDGIGQNRHDGRHA
ncbi:Uncharacterised protein [Mycobacteroides abscessus subsp. massiliense]|nr:Uncharacterised protein [Mycobacteroides abscessus subsp. massiliense]